jgi:hypothetical protein
MSYGFHTISEETAIVSLNNSYQLILVMDIRCDFFEIRIQFLNVIWLNFELQSVKNVALFPKRD